mmetsp:Transcript_7517/g.16058  ORF Transcript_7517/g.16058 Transcript_7517/m.16058 type:complete len:671 (-) Transcript_7517:32-2044(-)
MSFDVLNNASELLDRRQNPGRLTSMYLKSMGYLYLVAFLSYFVQYPGLSSRSGLIPSEEIFRGSFPQLYKAVVVRKGHDADMFADAVTIAGAFLSTLAAAGIVQHGLLYLSLVAAYNFLYTLGSDFYSFQWDILLLEAGFLTGVCIAPWTKLKWQFEGENEVGGWNIRFLLFKLMLMSGVVKIQANCPTWKNLTALEFHFATQCLPGPLAWYAHQMHPLLLRLGVAATFVIEMPAALLLIAPTHTLRKIGAQLQIFLQILIILTGNYNFFNLLTMAMCIPCMMAGDRESSRRWTIMQRLCCAAFLAACCLDMFAWGTFEDAWNREFYKIRFKMDTKKCEELFGKAIPVAVQGTLLFVMVTGISSAVGSTRTLRLCTSIRVVVCCACIIFTALPLYQLTPNLKKPAFLDIFDAKILRRIERGRGPFSNGYGLFRRMTGVGEKSAANVTEPSGWAGVDPSVVARPEIILEAQINGSSEWRELSFRWKPGRPDAMPLQVAPHQPRLDWLMWFAALGQIGHNPWLVAFIDKLLHGCPAAVDLINEPGILSGKQNVTMVRAILYHYDFTRVDTEWSRRIPGVEMTTMINGVRPANVWSRRRLWQYVTPLGADSAPLKMSLRQFRIRSGCSDGESQSYRSRTRETWTMICAALFVCLSTEWRRFSSRRQVAKLKIH